MTNPTLLTDLPPLERVALHALREASHGGPSERLLAALWLTCGQAAVERTVLAVEGVLQAVDSGARRPPLLAVPAAARLPAGERVLMALLRAERDARPPLAARLAAWLVRRPEQAPLRDHLRRLARELAVAPCAGRPPRPATLARFIA